MANPRPPRQRTRPEPTLYFAFGSNLSLAQMAARCPRSLYVGRAVLPDYCWQINTRGYANVVPSRGHSVQGLVYEIGPADEASLDRSEGVAEGCYSKGRCEVDLYPAPRKLYCRPVLSIVDEGGPGAVLERALRLGGERDITETEPIHDTLVLVYIDTERVALGKPREEYIGRINAGIWDAVTLGVDRKYFADVVRPFVPGEVLDSPSESEGAGGETAERRARAGGICRRGGPGKVARVRGRRVTWVELIFRRYTRGQPARRRYGSNQ